MNKALILKSLLTLLGGLSPRALGEITRLGGVTEDDLRAFMRLNAGEKALRHSYEGLLTGVRRYLDRASAPWPREVLTIFAWLSDHHRDDRTPFFLDPFSIRDNLNQGRDSFDRFMSRYEGCWRILRPSSAADGAKAVNRGFLNIRLKSVLDRTQQAAPTFSYYFREELGHGVDEVGKAVGLLFPMAERVNFLGQRLSSFNPHLVSMVWPVREARRGHATHAVGLSLIPNARRDHVASYVWASFIEGSELWDRDTYVQRRQEEIGSVTRYDMDKEEDRATVAEIVGEVHVSQFEKLRAVRPIVV